MMTVLFTAIAALSAVAALAWGYAVRDTMGREGMFHGGGLMPAGAATETD